ncbi:MAG: hypothetical protein EBT92_08250 [Planctomycetes bacterium]|nr:hypothetical protein [Planctomycetota bacterium]NBY01545.1 hypothetical protein [Planctomycetota bacterium]
MSRFLTICCLLFIFAQPALAQPALTQVRFGFPSESGPLIRNGAWNPVDIELDVKSAEIEPDKFIIELESTDGEGASYLIKIPVSPKQNRMMGYLRPGSPTSPLIVRLKEINGKILQVWPTPARSSATMVGPRDFLIATSGFSPEALLLASANQSKLDAGKQVLAERLPRKFSELKSIHDLPNQAIGYASLDTLIISTASIISSDLLKEEHSEKRAALSAWILSGGTLLLDSGTHYESTRSLLVALGVTGCNIEGLDSNPKGLRTLNGLNRWVTPLVSQLLPMRINEIAKLMPAYSAQTIIREPSEPSDPMVRPILVQIPFGRGRVFLLALGMDCPPFSKWDGQQSFWDKFLFEISPRNPGFAQGKFPPDTTAIRPEIACEIQRSLETFTEVPAFPFGWVALLILAYIIIIGPVDYFVTHYWLKKPELTWFTFLMVVLVGTWGAWAGANALKGDESKLNKLDILDLDVSSGCVQGTSWMSFFSPVPGNYSFTLQANPNWCSGDFLSQPDLGILETPDRIFRGASQSLFRKPYEYSYFPSSLEQVGIPAWACATLEGNWQKKAKSSSSPFIAELAHSRVETVLITGTITNNLSVDLEECNLFYQESWHNLGRFQSGEKRRIDMLQLGGRGQSIQQWNDLKILAPSNWTTQKSNNPSDNILPIHRLVKAFVFHDHPEAGDLLYNSSLRKLDTSWRLKQVAETFLSDSTRLRHPEDIILIGRVDPSKAFSSAPTSLSLSKKVNGNPTPIKPSINQETFVRVVIPIQQAKP